MYISPSENKCKFLLKCTNFPFCHYSPISVILIILIALFCFVSYQLDRRSIIEELMGNYYTDSQVEENVPFDSLSDNHNTSKHFQAKSNFAILKIGHFPKLVKEPLKNSIKQQKQVKQPTQSVEAQSKQSSQEKTSLSRLAQQESQKLQLPFNDQKYKIKSFKTINFTQFIEFKTTKVTDNYDFHGRIDGGSFGDVYKASLRTKTAKQQLDFRAIKIIPESKANESVIKQINMLRKLDHPNILKIYEVYRYNKMFYIVTEYLPGGNLMQLVSKGSKYSEYSIACIMKELMGGLVYLHNNNIIHRDIKPQNIVFESKPVPKSSLKGKNQKPKGKVAHTKLIDFGISIFKQSGGVVSGSVGTPYFMAPQVMAGCYDQKCDIWSCGVMLYFLLCGALPFKGSSTSEIFSQILYQKPSFQEKQWKTISKSAVILIKNMLNKERTLRISAKQVLDSDWMKNQKIQEIPFDEATLQNLKTHGFQDSFTAIVKTYIASMTTSVAQRRLIADKFMELDKDKSGFIDRQQLVQAFSRQGIPCPNIDQILAKADINKSGRIDFTEFLTIMTNQQTLFAKEKLAQAFEFLDADRTGYIEIEELNQVLKNESQEEIKSILQAFDKNGDNRISKDEFIHTMLECSADGIPIRSNKSKHQIKSKKQIHKDKKRESIQKQNKGQTNDLRTSQNPKSKKRDSTKKQNKGQTNDLRTSQNPKSKKRDSTKKQNKGQTNDLRTSQNSPNKLKSSRKRE